MKKRADTVMIIIIVVIIILLAILFISGYFGGLDNNLNGGTCEIGLGDHLCWRWSKTVLIE
ncbi:hypothetical protein GOV12_07115 [Candidatus Pacearchaeota archaeon]|nr:hypothetical protein [Candidatus Pacearchaeota archaeon]